MAISTYDTLKSGIADFLNRDDLTSVIPTFIDMAQGQINRDVRHWKMETTAQQGILDDYAYLPSSWLEIKNAQYYPDINDSTKFTPLEYLSQNAFDERKMNSENEIGDPKYYTCILYKSPSPRDSNRSRLPSSA